MEESVKLRGERVGGRCLGIPGQTCTGGAPGLVDPGWGSWDGPQAGACLVTEAYRPHYHLHRTPRGHSSGGENKDTVSPPQKNQDPKNRSTPKVRNQKLLVH